MATSFGQKGHEEQLPSRGRERKVLGGARRFTSSLNSLCLAPNQGWEEQTPVNQCFRGWEAVLWIPHWTLWNLEKTYCSLDLRLLRRFPSLLSQYIFVDRAILYLNLIRQLLLPVHFLP